MKNYQDWLFERKFSDTYPKNKYVELTPGDLTDYADELADLIQTAYAAKGGNPEFKNAAALLKSDITYWIAADIDSDDDPDVTLGGKPTDAGMKMTVLGQDGSQLARKQAVLKMIELTRQVGFYAEIEPEMAQKMGMAIIKDDNIIRKILGKHKIDMNPDGSYQRLVKGISKYVTKVLVGMPNI